MSLDADRIVDRRRLKRRLTFWRLTAVAALVLAAVAFAGTLDGVVEKDHVARLKVEGLILDDTWRDKALAELAGNDNIKALIVRIDSPGGTVVGGEALYKSILAVSKKKPVVAVLGGTAASAAYMAAVAAERIFARESTVTGSIGVIMQTTDITGLLDILGVKPETIKSRPLKAQPNPLEPMTEEARKAVKSVILDMYAMFVDLVSERRGMPRDRVLTLADGRIYSGRQAVANGLVDAIGGEDAARRWLEKAYKVDTSLPLEDMDISHDEEVWRNFIGGALGKALFSERLRLDGLLSLWQPSLL